MRVTVVGAGYVGLVLGACLAEAGHEVTCVDADPGRVRLLKKGRVPIFEPGLEELVKRNLAERRLEFSLDMSPGAGHSQVVFIAVPTPEGKGGDADLHFVLQAAGQVGRALRQYTVVVNKSTVPVGTADKVREVISGETELAFDVVSNPEFLKEGAAVEDFCRPDRVVLGASSERAARIMVELYSSVVADGPPILLMDTRSAELTKYASNAMLATRISFMNDVARLCEEVGADVEQVRRGVGSDSRIGPAFLSAGIGYGGSCFPKDVKAIISTARERGVGFELLEAVARTNERQKQLLLTRALKHYGTLKGRTFALWGLSFKPETDDMREAPSVELIEALLGHHAAVQAYDPVAREVAMRRFGDRLLYAGSPYEAVSEADGLFIVTEWAEFREADLDRVRRLLRSPVIFDGRNLFEPPLLRKLGFTHYPVGRSPPGANPPLEPVLRPAEVLPSRRVLGAGRARTAGLKGSAAPLLARAQRTRGTRD